MFWIKWPFLDLEQGGNMRIFFTLFRFRKLWKSTDKTTNNDNNAGLNCQFNCSIVIWSYYVNDVWCTDTAIHSIRKSIQSIIEIIPHTREIFIIPSSLFTLSSCWTAYSLFKGSCLLPGAVWYSCHKRHLYCALLWQTGVSLYERTFNVMHYELNIISVFLYWCCYCCLWLINDLFHDMLLLLVID